MVPILRSKSFSNLNLSSQNINNNAVSSNNNNNINNDKRVSVFGTLKRRSLKGTLRRKKIKLVQDECTIKEVACQAFPSHLRAKKEYDLEQRIEFELRMREGTTKLLMACQNSVQALEAAKSLITSNERMVAYIQELHQRRTLQRISQNQIDDVPTRYPCKARVSVSDIRIPLIWKDSDHFKNKGDYRRFAVFCLLKIGSEIYDTSLITKVDRMLTDITFEENMVFSEVDHNFEFQLEVYCNVEDNDLTIASTPRRIRHQINDSISRKVGRKLATSLRDDLKSCDIGPKFDLVAKARLCLDDVNSSIKTHDLILENPEKPLHQLPLFGNFCCRIAAQPNFFNEERVSGYITISKSFEKIDVVENVWASLKADGIYIWTDANYTELINNIVINKNTIVDASTRNQNEIVITQIWCDQPQIYSFVVNSTEEASLWLKHLQELVCDMYTWKHVSEKMMDIHSPAPLRPILRGKFRKYSLYDEMQLKESPKYANENNPKYLSTRLRSRNSSSSSSGTTSTASSSNSSASTSYMNSVLGRETAV